MNEKRLKILGGLIDMELYTLAKQFIDALQEEQETILRIENEFIKLVQDSYPKETPE